MSGFVQTSLQDVCGAEQGWEEWRSRHDPKGAAEGAIRLQGGSIQHFGGDMHWRGGPGHLSGKKYAFISALASKSTTLGVNQMLLCGSSEQETSAGREGDLLRCLPVTAEGHPEDGPHWQA